MLLGRHKARLIVGSGNSSIGGLVRNAEVFGRFDFDDADGGPPHPAFAALFDLATNLAAHSVPAVRAQLARAEAWTPWLRTGGAAPDERTIHVAAQKGTRLLSVLEQAVGGERITRVVALSASFDRKLEAVRELAYLGSGIHETFVVVQGDRANIDGSAVGGMPKSVRWGEFVDPRPSKKQQPGDSYAHAKLYLIETEVHDHLFFGSANASSPGLLTGANTELLVQLPREAPGTWIERLGLQESLASDARDKLLGRSWKSEDDRPAGLIHLGGVEWSPGRWIVSLASPMAKAGAQLALGERALRTTMTIPLERDGEQLTATAVHALEGTRFAWVVDSNGKQVSTIVAATWPEVSRTRLGGWFGSGVEAAILSMKHGDVLGPILFEFLDRIPDLNLMTIGSVLKKDKVDDPADGADDATRSTESFYTDVTAEADKAARVALGDRSDLDLLASLVQPIAVQQVASRENDEDDDDDDSSIAEEQERRALDSKKAAADGSERAPSATLPSAARMAKAGKRFARRVGRAADSLGETQAAIANQSVALPPGIIARQVWMAYIAAFVAGRAVETADQGEQVVVESDVLAHYVLRCASALAGDASGGLLRAIPAASWKTRDGATLSDGLRFLVVACSWAVAWFEQRYAATGWSPDDDAREAVGIHDAIPLLVLARLIGVCDDDTEPDFSDARRRLSAWSDVGEDAVEKVYRRARNLAAWSVTIEREPLAAANVTHAPVVGAVVRLHGTGVAVVLRIDGEKLWVSMLSRPNKPAVKFTTSWTRPVQAPAVGALMLAPLPSQLFG